MTGYDPKKFMEYQSNRRKQSLKQRSARRKGSAALTRALLLPESIKQFVTKARLDLFGSEEPPFSDIEKMGEWIKQEALTQPLPEGHAPRYGYRLEMDTTIEELNAMYAKRPGVYGLEFASLSFPTNDNWTSVVMVSDGTLLRKIWLVVRHIAKELDCQEGQATALFLAGKLPVVPALSAQTLPTFHADRPNKGKIEIVIREPISEDVLINAYRKLRKALWGDIKDRQPASDRDCKLVEFVIQNLDPDNPQWENLMKIWNKEHPDLAFYGDSGYRGFRKAYIDAKQKIYPDIHWGDVTLTN